MSADVEIYLEGLAERVAVRIHDHPRFKGALFSSLALGATPGSLVAVSSRLLGWVVGNIDAANPHFVRILNGPTNDPSMTVAGIELASLGTSAQVPTWPGVLCPNGIFATGSAGNTLLTVFYSLV